MTLALERPGASGDQGVYSDRIELQNIKARFPLPDFSGAYKFTQDWGYVRAAGMLRVIKWDDVLDDQFDLSGDATGWGLNLSSNLKAGKKDVIRLQFVFGEGIQNYMNDSPVDIGIVNNFSNPVTPILGKPIPIVGIVAFLDHTWNEKFSSCGRLLVAGQRQHRGPGRQRVQGRPLCARQPPLLPGPERDGRRRIPVGPPRELLGRIPERRRQGAVLVQIQLLVEAWRIVMNHRHRNILVGSSLVAIVGMLGWR